MNIEPPLRENVILVALVVPGRSRKESEEYLHQALPRDIVPLDEWEARAPFIESWWVAEDQRYDGSDNDSAVFCKKGKQREASKALRDAGLTDT